MLDVVVLAAGRGTRMLSRRPKVLHDLCGRPLLQWVIEAAFSVLGIPPLVVIGPDHSEVSELFAERARFCIQPTPRGTGDAIAQALPYLMPDADTVLVLHGDMPLLQAGTLQQLVDCQGKEAGPALALLVISRLQSQGFGRVVRDTQGGFSAIVEERNCTPSQLAISEFNAGVYVFKVEWLRKEIGNLTLQSSQEKYLTDMPGMAVAAGIAVQTVAAAPEEASGINTRVELAEAARLMRRRINSAHMLSGVTIVDPASTYIDADVIIGSDTHVGPGTVLTGATRIGQGCKVGFGTELHNTSVGNNCRIRQSSLEGATLEDDCDVGPFARMRPGAHLGQSVHVGSFGEIKNSHLGNHVTMGHFSYVGDADIAAYVNIGAGTITCNFDGDEKHRTVVEEGAFLGSGTKLVAPVRVGREARTGAGSVITRDVPARTLVYGVPARPKAPDLGVSIPPVQDGE